MSATEIKEDKHEELDAIGNRRKIRMMFKKSSVEDIDEIGILMRRLFPVAIEVLESLFAHADQAQEPILVLATDDLWKAGDFDRMHFTEAVLLRRYCAAVGYPTALTICGLIVPPKSQPLTPVTAMHLACQ